MYIHERKDWPDFHWKIEKRPTRVPVKVLAVST